MLVRGIETARNRGDGDAHLDLILSVARGAGQPERNAADAEAAFKAAFFKPLAPFLIKETLSVRQPGRINIGSVDAIWTWMKRDVARDLVGAAMEAVRASPDSMEVAAEAGADAVRTKILPMGRRYMKLLSTGEDDLQRLAGQLGDKKTLDDARDTLEAFQYSETISAVFKKMTEKNDQEPAELLRLQIGQIKTFADNYPRHLHLFAIRYLEYASNPAALVRLARLLSKAENAAALEKSHYKPFVDVAWSEIDRRVEIVRGRRDLTDTDGTLEEAVLELHRTVRQIQIVLDVEGMTEWARRLAHFRSETSNLLRQLVEATPSLVKKALRPQKQDDRMIGPDPAAVAEAREALLVLRAARQAIDSLALNNIVMKVRSQVEQVVENSSKTYVDRLRVAPSVERSALTGVVEVIIDFAEIVFDEHYAALIRRSLHVASTKAELKSA